MTSTPPIDPAERIKQLEGWLARRKGVSGYETNVKEIEAEIARLKAEVE